MRGPFRHRRGSKMVQVCYLPSICGADGSNLPRPVVLERPRGRQVIRGTNFRKPVMPFPFASPSLIMFCHVASPELRSGTCMSRRSKFIKMSLQSAFMQTMKFLLMYLRDPVSLAGPTEMYPKPLVDQNGRFGASAGHGLLMPLLRDSSFASSEPPAEPLSFSDLSRERSSSRSRLTAPLCLCLLHRQPAHPAHNMHWTSREPYLSHRVILCPASAFPQTLRNLAGLENA